MDFSQVIGSSRAEKTGLFLITAQRLDAPLINVEKDFWVCWTLNALYHRLPFKGGTSLSKAYGLISWFSEDIDITVFPDDLGHPDSTAELTALSNKKRKAALNAIAEDCRTYVTTDILASVLQLLLEDTIGERRVEIDETDQSGQKLLFWYPGVDATDTVYVRAAIKIESGAKSALDPNKSMTITPNIAEDVATLDLTVPGVTTIDAES